MKKPSSLLGRLVPTGGTAERVVKGAFWAMSQNTFGRVLQLAMLVILARLIGPAEIGLVGIALLSVSAIQKFTNFGLNAALVQREEENVDEHLNTMWILEILRGSLIFVVLFFLAPFIGQLFSEPRATDLIRVIGLSPLLFGLTNPGVMYFQKKLEFHKQFVLRVGGEIAQFVVAVAVAMVEPTAWAFVAGYVAADVVRLVASYLMHSYRPSIQFDRESAGELIGYGKWITGSSILYFLYSEGDDAFVGWFINPAALAFYQYGYRFSNAPATELTSVISSVMFPAFSKIQADASLLRETFRKTLRVNAFISAPVAFGIAVVAPDFVMTFFGSEWESMIVPMQILAAYGFLRALGQTFGPVWKALDRPDIITKLSAVRVVLMAILIWPMTDAYGIAGTAATVTIISIFPMIPLDIYVTVKMLGLRTVEVYREIAFPTCASILMAAIVWFVDQSLTLPAAAELVISIVVGAVSYLALVFVFERQFQWGIGRNIRSIVSAARR
ncbi:lipopolysaccharide biosynthesis protein [Halogranum rubrum]|uniref:Membrane protein involved in the export of O-antigen and teichoic acid n=1 Tax=Halogranum salarium B-1 TaxID=1210908 RepID=J3JDV5_9EURY|nr:lipopolysaccharide biosynthesis protein [Halogranum salarium]EJN57819.1 membrane protein involved in the export of O-antigen and teichoic acid [Halogranum salarium B-1]